MKISFVIRNQIVISKINVALLWYHWRAPAILLDSKVVPLSR